MPSTAYVGARWYRTAHSFLFVRARRGGIGFLQVIIGACEFATIPAFVSYPPGTSLSPAPVTLQFAAAQAAYTFNDRWGRGLVPTRYICPGVTALCGARTYAYFRKRRFTR